MKKLIFALIVVAALLIVAMPIGAQGPDPYIPVRMWYNRTAEMSATWAGDPFGGNPMLGIAVRYVPDGKGGVAAVTNQGVAPGSGTVAYGDPTGIVAKYGLSPWRYDPYSSSFGTFVAGEIQPGGIQSRMSGNGGNPFKAIYIGGAWVDASDNLWCSSIWDPNTNVPLIRQCRNQSIGENPLEVPGCATVMIPAGNSKWFKFDTWKKDNAGRRLQTEVWIDDELDSATKPSGSAVFGAANKYYWGTAPMDGWSGNALLGTNPMNSVEINGFFGMIFSPDVLKPNYAFAPPNASLLTVEYSGTGSARRSCTAAAYAGQPCVPASKGGPSTSGGLSLSGLRAFLTGWADYFDFMEFNKSQPSHLMWYSTNGDGWYFLRVWNQMIWEGTVSVCSYRRVQ